MMKIMLKTEHCATAARCEKNWKNTAYRNDSLQ